MPLSIIRYSKAGLKLGRIPTSAGKNGGFGMEDEMLVPWG